MTRTIALSTKAFLALALARSPALAQVGPESPPSAAVSATKANDAGGSAGAQDVEPALASFNGPVGLFHLTTADVGPSKQLRFGLHGELFRWSGLVVPGDQNTRLRGGLVAGYTPGPRVEVFAGILGSSNRNCRPRCGDASDPGRVDPEVVKSFGDLVLGAKGRLPVRPGLALALEGGVKMLASSTDLLYSPGSASAWLGSVISADLRTTTRAPLRLHANAGFYLDGSGDVDGDAMASLPSREAWRFASGAERSRLRTAVGADAPLRVGGGVVLQPFAEYHAELITSRADPAFADALVGCPQAPEVHCATNRDQQWLTVGVRARAWRGLTLDLGADVAVRHVAMRYGAALAPYNVIFGASYAVDVGSPGSVQVVTRTVEKVVERHSPPPAPTTGHATGVVRSTVGGGAVAGAIVAALGRPRARASTDPDGSFLTAALPPGTVELEASAPGFEPARSVVTIVAGRDVPVDLRLVPRPPTGNVRGRIVDEAERGIAVSLKMMGPDNFEARSEATGDFSAALPVGAYLVRVEGAGFLVKEARVEIAAGQEARLDLVLRTRPAIANVGVTPAGIVLRDPGAVFRTASADVHPAAWHLLDEVADAILTHPELARIRVEAHADASLPRLRAQDLTRRQAEAVRDYLTRQGVDPSRLEAVGAGSTRPLVPNIGPANRAKNRRIELVRDVGGPPSAASSELAPF